MTLNTAPENGWPHGRVGHIALLGRPNAGKSTLLNTVLGQHLAAVSARPQTTRRRFLGIYTTPQAQMLFQDAPGVHQPADALSQCMDRTVQRVLEEADAVLCLADPTRAPGEEDRLVAARAAAVAVPVILALNKRDLASAAQVEAMEAFYRQVLPAVAAYRVSALDRPSLEPLLEALSAALPNGPFLYPAEETSDSFVRDIGAELIREACLERLLQEVPHAVAVTIDEWREDSSPLRVQATIHVEREMQKRIVVGHGGAMINAIRAAAEAKLGDLCQERVRVRLWVKVSPGWRDQRARLREFNLLD